MNPVQLLAVTESLVESKDKTGRYRLSKQGLLPRFGSPKNPFAERTPESSGPSSAVSTATAKSALPENPPTPTPAAAKESTSPARRAVTAILGRGGRTVGRWVERLRRLRIPWFQSQAPKPATWRKAVAPVQTELSLDNVRVVRNDLRESDLEVVPLRSSAPRKVTEPAVLQSAQPAPAAILSRWTVRFRRAGQVPVH